jgi:hypothetical protein
MTSRRFAISFRGKLLATAPSATKRPKRRQSGGIGLEIFSTRRHHLSGDPDAPGEISTLIGAMTASNALLARLKAMESPEHFAGAEG